MTRLRILKMAIDKVLRMLYIDLLKTYDSAYHSKLIAKLYVYSISDVCCCGSLISCENILIKRKLVLCCQMLLL